MDLLRTHPAIESIFEPWALELGQAHDPHKGRVYRLFNFCRALLDPDERFAITPAFPDTGFHLLLTRALLGYGLSHPLKPLPMLKM